MEKEHLSTYYDESNLSMKRKANDKRLDISSTGYGLESVSNETKKDTLQESKNRTSSREE
ncbi:hypothetical protein [Peribacillus asahii]|uniref:hypothetical protein n=1 Tax=Peribacillus asahii TaxID=228899 RepID=UPI0037FFC0E2